MQATRKAPQVTKEAKPCSLRRFVNRVHVLSRAMGASVGVQRRPKAVRRNDGLAGARSSEHAPQHIPDRCKCGDCNTHRLRHRGFEVWAAAANIEEEGDQRPRNADGEEGAG
jgi:hypothetical protein